MTNEKESKQKRAKREKTAITVLVGSRIKSLRSSQGISQAVMAEAAGISPKYIGEVERGEANISIELIGRLAMALNVPMSAILENEHEQPHEKLILEIQRLSPYLGEKDAQLVYRMVKALTE